MWPGAFPRTSLFWPGPCELQSPPYRHVPDSPLPEQDLVQSVSTGDPGRFESRSSNKSGQTLRATHLPHRVLFSNGSWNKISVPRKALLSTTAKHSILQNNFQLYSLEYRHLPHQLHQGTVSSAQPALTASLVPSATPTALQGALKPLSFCPHHGWVLKLLTSLTSRLVQRKLYPEVCNLTKLREPCKAHSSTSASSIEWFQIILPLAPEHTIAINLSIITSTQILEVFCKTKAEMPLSGIRATTVKA